MSEEKVAKRSKKSPVYSLERIVEVASWGTELSSSVAEKFIIIEVATGFNSPEKALEYANAKKIQGTLRVVRVASGMFEGAVVVQEPVYSLNKLFPEPEKKPGRKPRKSKESTTKNYPVAPPVDNDHVAPGCEQFSTAKDKVRSALLDRVSKVQEQKASDGIEAIPPDDEGLNPEPDGAE